MTDPRELDVVTMTLKSDPRSFTESELNTIRDQIALLLHQQGSVNININIGDIVVEPKSGKNNNNKLYLPFINFQSNSIITLFIFRIRRFTIFYHC